MQIGFNNDVKYRDKTFHIQTEDHGMKLASIESQIFHSGAIYDTSIISYKKVLDKTEDHDARVKKIRLMMQANHKSLYNKLLAGEYDEFAGLEPLKKGEKIETDELVPSQDRVPEAALKFEKGEEPFPEQEQGEFVSIDDIQKKLLEDEKAAEAKAAETKDESKIAPVKSAALLDNKDKKPKASKSVPLASKSMLRAKMKSSKMETESKSLIPDFTTSGVNAYRGITERKKNLGITELVEIFLAS